MNRDTSTRVGFVLPAGHWLGGKNYLRNLFAAVGALPGKPITPVILTGTRQGDASSDFPGHEIIAAPILDRKSTAWFARKALALAASEDVLLQRLLLQHKVSVLSHSMPLGKAASMKTIGWIPDFQHLHLPEFFSRKECSRRDRVFRRICLDSDRIIVSSECARTDLMSFSPGNGHKAELLHFVANPLPSGDAANLRDLERIYGFEGPYFLLPNQFWVHKNHRVVITALQALKRQNKPLLVLATGSSQDYRDPSFYPALMRFAADCEVLDCFRVLGQIPFNHLTCLMQHAIAFINPSRFEGWSTSVEEAKSLAKQIVLSDIPVHREQAPPRGLFFPPDQPDALAQAMIAAYNGFDRQHDLQMQEDARARFPERQREFGAAYQAIVTRAASE